MSIYYGIDKDGIPRVWGISKQECQIAIKEYNEAKPDWNKKALCVVKKQEE